MTARAIAALLLAGCSSSSDASFGAGSGGATGSFTLTSPAFADGGAIPYRHGYNGLMACGPGTKNLSPPLAWSGAPAGTKSFAVSMLDASAKNFVHWVAWDIGGSQTSLAEGAGAAGTSPPIQGQNSYGPMPLGYAGPCPPAGDAHSYVFTLYAIGESTVGLQSGSTASQLGAAMNGKVIGQTTLTGSYKL